MKRFLALLAVLGLLIPGFSVRATTTAELEAAIIEACTYNTPVDLSSWELTGKELEALFFPMKEAGKLPWYTYTFSYTHAKEEDKVLTFTPKNRDPEIFDRALYEQRITEAMDECILEGMSPLQIALAVHDWIAVNCVYDEAIEEKTDYGLLVKGTTVCAGYTAVYRDILNRAGVPCVGVTSEPMNHSWNLVQLDGQWYHVDVTWDDPTSDVVGRVKHTYFLLSDREIAELDSPHYGWETDIRCESELYADGYWKNTFGRICFASSDLSYRIDKEDSRYSLIARTESTGQEKVLYTESAHYLDLGQDSRYSYGHYGLSFAGGRLFFGVQDQILSIAPDETAPRVEYTHDTRGTKTYIAGVHLTPEGLAATISDHDKNYSVIRITPKTALTATHQHSYQETVTPPTCTETGITDWVCGCGLSCRGAPTAATGHDLQQTSLKKATIFADGHYTDTCTSCGYTETTVLAQIPLKVWLKDNRRTISYLVFEGILVIVALVNVVLLVRENKKQKRSPPPDKA